nr:aldehyde dehydrogenase family protein [Rhizobium mesoamericanum]
MLHQAAQALRERADKIARIITTGQGKPLAESRMETLSAAETIDWFAEEGKTRP